MGILKQGEAVRRPQEGLFKTFNFNYVHMRTSVRGHVHMSPGAIVIGSPKSSTSTLGTKPGPSERAISSALMYVSGRGGTSHTTVTVTMRGRLCLRSQMSQISWGQEGPVPVRSYTG